MKIKDAYWFIQTAKQEPAIVLLAEFSVGRCATNS